MRCISGIRIGLVMLLFLSASVYGQTGAMVADLQGSVLNRGEPPEPAVPLQELNGVKVMITPKSDVGFNLVLFNEDATSLLFKIFQYPGKSMEANGVRIPGNAYPFFGTVQDGNVTGDLYVFSGEVSTDDPRGPQGILYAGSLDNPVIIPPDSAPVYSWDFATDGIVGNGDNLACQEARGPVPPAGFIAVIERGTCSFLVKAQNTAKAGAVAVIVFNHEPGGDTFVPYMVTPGASIPSVFIRRSDGLNLVKWVDDYRSTRPTLALIPTNLFGTISGTFKTNADGSLQSVKLNLVIGDQDNSIFAGTVSR